MFLYKNDTMARFMGKNPHRKVVRRFPNMSVSHTIPVVDIEQKIVENKEIKTEEDMADERIEKIEQLMGTKAPKRKVKVEKKDKGLLERTDNSTILLTEDNKMVLTD